VVDYMFLLKLSPSITRKHTAIMRLLTNTRVIHQTPMYSVQMESSPFLYIHQLYTVKHQLNTGEVA